jgi:hypothetical protein
MKLFESIFTLRGPLKALIRIADAQERQAAALERMAFAAEDQGRVAGVRSNSFRTFWPLGTPPEPPSPDDVQSPTGADLVKWAKEREALDRGEVLDDDEDA